MNGSCMEDYNAGCLSPRLDYFWAMLKVPDEAWPTIEVETLKREWHLKIFLDVVAAWDISHEEEIQLLGSGDWGSSSSPAMLHSRMVFRTNPNYHPR